MSRQVSKPWFCPFYKRDIAEGQCLDINYERIGLMEAGCIREVARLTGKTKAEIDETCKACPNFPFKEGLPQAILDG